MESRPADRLRCLATTAQALEESAAPAFGRSAGHLRGVVVGLSAMAGVSAARLMARERSRRVESDIAPGLTVKAAPELLSRVLERLLDNAWKFSRGACPARIEFGCVGRHAGAGVYFVRDNGAGFDPRETAALFSIFHRLPNAATCQRNGIGLAMRRRLVERHGGWVRADALPGRGATFMVALPDQDAVRGRAAPSPSCGPAARGAGRTTGVRVPRPRTHRMLGELRIHLPFLLAFAGGLPLILLSAMLL